MLAGLIDWSLRRRGALLLASLCLAPALAWADPAFDVRLAELREVNRFMPEQALPALEALEAQGRAAPVAARVEYLSQLSQAYLGVGKNERAMALADEVIALAKRERDNVALAKGLLTKAFVSYQMTDMKASHQLTFEAERVAAPTDDAALKIQTMIAAGQTYAEQGNFPSALLKAQKGVEMARALNSPVVLTSALRSLSTLYMQMKEYDKGFAAVEEAWDVAVKLDSPGRMALAKTAEYGLAIEVKQPRRALKALETALALERKMGATTMIASTLVDLSDSYLKAQDYPSTLRYGTEALEANRKLNDANGVATAMINIGQAYLGMGRVAEGKKNFEAGLAYYEKMNDKPELQAVLMEYGSSLEKAGDFAGAVAAYHRERSLSNELFETERQKAVYELQEKYEADKKERQIELLQRESQVKSTEIDNRRLQQRVWWLLAVVFALASVIVGLLYRKVRHANAQLEVKNLELKAQSSRDPLTTLYNRRHFQEFMRTHSQIEKRGEPATGDEIVGAIFLLDVDHFKFVNDTYGHAAGDIVLKMIAENLREIVRETDMIVRWGGEEFLIFLPAIPRSGVEDIARRILSGISATSIQYQEHTISVNLSIGFAPFPLIPGSHPLPWERAVNVVDMALYMAKAHGRNRAYGVRGFHNFEQTSMEEIEQDLERAWRAGFVDLSVVLGTWPDPRPSQAALRADEAPAAGAGQSTPAH